MLISLLLILELIQQVAVVNFMLFFNLLKMSNISFWTFEWETDLLPSELFLN